MFFVIKWALYKTDMRKNSIIFAYKERIKMEKDKKRVSIVLTRDFYNAVGCFADFLCLSKCDMMQLLLNSGLSDYEEKPYRIIYNQVAEAEKIELKKLEDRLDKIGLMYQKHSKSGEKNNIKMQKEIEKLYDKIEEKKGDLETELSEIFIRPTIYLFDEQIKKIDKVIEEQRANVKRLSRSKVIYTLIHHALYKELYDLSYQPFWKMNLYQEAKVLKPRKITVTIPEILYFGLCVSKDQMGVSMQSYLTAVLYDDFISKQQVINDTLQKQLEKVKKE